MLSTDRIIELVEKKVFNNLLKKPKFVFVYFDQLYSSDNKKDCDYCMRV